MDSITFQIDDLFFSWDERKSRANFKNHGVAFQETATCWLDENTIETYDEEHSETETRWLMIGKSDVGRILTCWYTERRFGEQEVIRLIGARRSTTSEKSLYYEKAKQR
jgi:uncharacterized DUF497 family protein